MREAIRRMDDITSYGEAEALFVKKSKPKSKYWTDENERPLAEIAARDLRLARRKMLCPDTDKIVQVYQATWGPQGADAFAWVTFYPSTENGAYRVSAGIQACSNSTEAFVVHFLKNARRVYSVLEGTGNTRQGYVPLYPQRHCELLKHSASFTLLFNKDGHIIPSRSWHPTLVKRSSTAVDNDFRARLRAKWYPICYMAAVGAEPLISEKIADAAKVNYVSTEFSTSDLPGESLLSDMENDINDGNSVRNYDALLRCACLYAVDKFLTEAWEANYIASRENLASNSPLLEADRRTYRRSALRRAAIALYVKNYGLSRYLAYENLGFTAEHVATALARMIVGKYHRNVKSGREVLPMFPDPALLVGDIIAE